MKKDKRNLLSMMTIVAFLAIAVASSKSKEGKSSDKGSSSSSTATTSSSDTKVQDKKADENWEYTENVDKMSGDKSYFAKATSINTLDFKFPYAGGSSGYLFVRKMSKESDLALVISKGQFMPGIMSSESVRIKFDDEKPMTVAYNSPEDGSSTTIFIQQSKTMIAKLKKAKKVTIEAPFFEAGRQMLDFNIEGLKWDR